MEEDGECVCVVCVLMCMEKKKPKKNSGRTRVFSNRAVDANHQHDEKPTEKKKKEASKEKKKKPEAIGDKAYNI